MQSQKREVYALPLPGVGGFDAAWPNMAAASHDPFPSFPEGSTGKA